MLRHHEGKKKKKRGKKEKKKGIKIKRNFKIVKLKNINNNNKGKNCVIPLFSCFSCDAYSEGPLVYLETSLALWGVWSQFCVRYSLVPACICSQSL